MTTNLNVIWLQIFQLLRPMLLTATSHAAVISRRATNFHGYIRHIKFQSAFHAGVILSKPPLISGCEFQLQSSSRQQSAGLFFLVSSPVWAI
jgi:hypothetical protein